MVPGTRRPTTLDTLAIDRNSSASLLVPDIGAESIKSFLKSIVEVFELLVTTCALRRVLSSTPFIPLFTYWQQRSKVLITSGKQNFRHEIRKGSKKSEEGKGNEKHV